MTDSKPETEALYEVDQSKEAAMRSFEDAERGEREAYQSFIEARAQE